MSMFQIKKKKNKKIELRKFTKILKSDFKLQTTMS